MKTKKSNINSHFIIELNNIKNEILDESKRVYSLNDYNEDSILFI